MNVSLIEGSLVAKYYLEKLARLESELFNDAWDVLAISSVLSGFGAGVIVVESDQEVLGYCIYQAVFEVAEILRIATAKHCQKNGIGGLILNHLASHCIEKQAERILLEVRADNLAAIALYKKFDFHQIDTRASYYQDKKTHQKIDALIFQKLL